MSVKTTIDNEETTMNGTMVFGPNGTFISMNPSPDYESISGNLIVDNATRLKAIW